MTPEHAEIIRLTDAIESFLDHVPPHSEHEERLQAALHGEWYEPSRPWRHYRPQSPATERLRDMGVIDRISDDWENVHVSSIDEEPNTVTVELTLGETHALLAAAHIYRKRNFPDYDDPELDSADEKLWELL